MSKKRFMALLLTLAMVVTYMPAMTFTAYAKNYNYTLTYNANGGTGAPAAEKGSAKDADKEFTISSKEPTRTGYDFLGWGDSDTDTEAKYSAGGTITLTRTNTSKTIYAIWKAHSYSITYKDKGDNPYSGTNADKLQSTHTYDSKTSLIAGEKEGYIFDGWYTNSACTEGKTMELSGKAYTSDIELFVNWKQITYSISFDANGGSGAPADLAAQASTTFTLPSDIPTNGSKTFDGWYVSGAEDTKYAAGTEYTFDATNFTGDGAEKTLTLKAAWADKKAPEITTPPTASDITYGQTLADSTLTGGVAKVDGTPIEGTFTWKDDTTAPVAGDGQEFDVVFIPSNGTLYTSVEGKATVDVAKAEQTITADTTQEFTYGETGKSITADAEGTLSYAVKSGEDVVAVDDTTGALTINKVGEATVTVTAAETDCYNEASKDIIVVINQASWVITADDPQTFEYGQSDAAVAATCDAPLGYELKDGDDVVEIDTVTGALTIKKAGSAIVVVHVDPDENHKETTKDITITINKKTIDKPTFPQEDGKDKVFTYTGEAQTLELVGFDSDKMELAGDSAALTQTNAGTYIVKVNAKDNYQFASDCSLSWIINKADYTAEELPTSLSYNVTKKKSKTITFTVPDGATLGNIDPSSNNLFSNFAYDKTAKTLNVTAKNSKGTANFNIPVTGDSNHKNATINLTINVADHKHGSYTYSADGNVLTATCGAEGCDEPAYAITMTLGFDGFTDGKVEYTGRAIEATTTLSDGSATTPGWPVTPAPTAIYTADGKTLDSAPKDCGAYTVSITQGTATATLGYEIVHTHSWAYATDDTDKNVINVTCDSPASGCPDSYATTLTVDAEGKTYDGEAVEATVEKAENWDDTIAEYTLSYEKKNSEGRYVAMSDGAKPTDAGDYKAVITLGGATAYVEFTIDKAEIDMPTFPQEDGEDKVYTYNGEEQTFEPEGFDGDTMTLSENTTQTDAGTYAVTVTPKANYKWSASGDCEFTWEIAQRVVSIEWGEEDTFTYKDQSTSYEMTFTLGNVVEGDEVNATVEGNVKTNSGKYTAKITELDNDNYALPETGLTKKWTINKAAIKMPTADTTEFVYNGEEQEYKPVGFDPDTMTIAGNKATTAKKDRLCGVNPKSNYQWEEGRVDCKFTWTINKADIDYDAPYAVMGLVFTDSEQELINAGEVRPFGTDDLTMEYSLSEDDDYTDDATTITGTDAGDYTVWYKIDGGDNYNDVKGSITVTIDGLDPTFTTEPTANTGLEYTGDAQALVTEGATENGTVEYQIGETVDDEAWGDYDSIKVTDAGDYTVWYRIAGDKNYNNTEPQSIEVSIEKVDSTLDVAPVEKSGLIYNGKAQALVTAGVATGGTVMYRINGGGWTDTATGINHGEYSVTYYVKGDKNHNDIAATGDALIVNIARNHISGVKLSYTKYTYNGKVHTPSATVTDVNKKTLKKGTDYTVSVGKSNKKPGTYKVVVKGIGNYSGIITKSYKIAVKTPTISKLARLSKSFKITVKKLSSTYVTGYQLRYSTSSKMTNAKTVTIGTKNTVVSKTVKNLKAKKKYYVQVRAYKTISGKKYASAWGTAKTVTTK